MLKLHWKIKKFLGQNWTSGDSLGTIWHSGPKQQKYAVFPLWKPKIWNSFCITVDSITRKFESFLNGKVIYQTDRYTGYHEKSFGNFILLNGFSFIENIYSYPFKGEITDVNIWNETLDNKFIESWSGCQDDVNGNLLNWKFAKIVYNKKDVDMKDIDKSDICQCSNSRSRKIIAFTNKLSFKDSLKFCQKIFSNFVKTRTRQIAPDCSAIFQH